MDDYAGRVLADRYRLPLPPTDEYELTETRAFDTYSGQEVLVRQVPLPEVVEAEVLDAEGLPDGFTARDPRGARERGGRRTSAGGSVRHPTDPAVRRAVEAAQAAARIPDHPRLDQVFDVFAEGGSLWIVSELVAARSLATLLVEKPLTPYRAAEVAADVLMALRVLHAHGWVHRNVTARTVLVCDDGRVMLTGLAVGAAEEALCGYDPVPPEDAEWDTGGGESGAGRGPAGGVGPGERAAGQGGAAYGSRGPLGPGGPGGRGGAQGPVSAVGLEGAEAEAARRAAIEARAAGALPAAGAETTHASPAVPARRAVDTGADIRAARAGAIAAYRAGARAAARVQEAQNGRAALPGARPSPEDDPAARADGSAQHPPYPTANGAQQPSGSGPPGQVADPYGVQGASWHGAAPRGGAAGPQEAGGVGQGERGRTALPSGGVGGTGGIGGTGGTVGDGGAAYAGGSGGQHAMPMPGGSGGQHAAPMPGGPGLGPGLGSGPVPAGGVGGVHDGGSSALPPGAALPPSTWDEPAAGAPARRGPTTALAAERARQARMAVVGAVTERWAPEQAGPVHENWQLAAPIGPATDLWALGALLFRAVQGHAPYPEESTAELVQLVCAEPPAFAEECGPLRPVVESLLRQDPTERLDFEEVNGWLRSLVRSAPEPEAGAHVVAAPPADTSRLPVVRRRGELVRRRRAGLPAHHGRHKRAREEARSPRRLGRALLLLILLLLAGAIAYAMLFMPKSDSGTEGAGDRTGAVDDVSPAPEPSSEASSEPRPEQTSPGSQNSPSSSAGSTEKQTTGPDVPDGFALRKDAEGFQVAVANGWDRTPVNGRGQVVYGHGNFELIVVPGRDSAAEDGSDPMVYQREKEPELQPYRDSSWATATGLKTIQVGGRTMAEGQFTWTGDDGRELYVRNIAMLVGGKYHVVQVRGPEAERDEVTRLYEQASATYRITG
ncbi:protein kinase [Streptomyces sp. NBC_01231]|nr:protein kinase [Streptomyces sp. NBC_01231]